MGTVIFNATEPSRPLVGSIDRASSLVFRKASKSIPEGKLSMKTIGSDGSGKGSRPVVSLSQLTAAKTRKTAVAASIEFLKFIPHLRKR